MESLMDAHIRAEFKTERDTTIGFDGQPRREVVRVFFRAPGERRWRKKIVVPGDGMTVEMVEERAQDIADKLLAGEVDRG